MNSALLENWKLLLMSNVDVYRASAHFDDRPALVDAASLTCDHPPMAAIYALNLLDLADNDDYRGYMKISGPFVEKHGGKVVSIGRLSKESASTGGEPRSIMVVVEWPSAEAFEAFKNDPSADHAHHLRESGTKNYLWWAYDKLEDLRPIFREHRDQRTK